MVDSVDGDESGRICSVVVPTVPHPSLRQTTLLPENDETIVDAGAHGSGVALTIFLFCAAIVGGALLTTGLVNLCLRNSKGARR